MEWGSGPGLILVFGFCVTCLFSNTVNVFEKKHLAPTYLKPYSGTACMLHFGYMFLCLHVSPSFFAKLRTL